MQSAEKFPEKWQAKCTEIILIALFLCLYWELGTSQSQARVRFCEAEGHCKAIIPTVLVLCQKTSFALNKVLTGQNDYCLDRVWTAGGGKVQFIQSLESGRSC